MVVLNPKNWTKPLSVELDQKKFDDGESQCIGWFSWN